MRFQNRWYCTYDLIMCLHSATATLPEGMAVAFSRLQHITICRPLYHRYHGLVIRKHRVPHAKKKKKHSVNYDIHIKKEWLVFKMFNAV